MGARNAPKQDAPGPVLLVAVEGPRAAAAAEVALREVKAQGGGGRSWGRLGGGGGAGRGGWGGGGRLFPQEFGIFVGDCCSPKLTRRL